MNQIKTWQSRIHKLEGGQGAGFLTIQQAMQQEIDELRQAIEQAEKVEPVDGVLLDDMVEGQHPEYGRGLFATDNCVKKFYTNPPTGAAQQAEWAEPIGYISEFDGDSAMDKFRYLPSSLYPIPVYTHPPAQQAEKDRLEKLASHVHTAGYSCSPPAAPVQPAHSITTCNPHLDAPHGFARNASHAADRHVCECEGWMPPVQQPLTVREIAEFVGTNNYGAVELTWFRLGEAAHGIKGASL